MPIFENTERLVQALQILSFHKDDITNFYISFLKLQVRSEGIGKLKETFRASVSERRGASFERGRIAVQTFDTSVEELVQKVNNIINDNPQEAHRILFESLVKIPNIEQKIAAMFIKFLIVYLNVWPEMIPYLYVPIDRVVLKILGEKLKVYNGPWNQSPGVKNQQGKLYVRGNGMSAQYTRFIAFQDELLQICQAAGVNRILVDELWFIGYIFCKEYPLCNQCWLKGVCQNSPVGPDILL